MPAHPAPRRLRSARGRQRGFTLVELMVATSIGLVLLGSVYGILVQTTNMAEVTRGQITLNQNAREMFHMLEDGGIDPTDPGRLVRGMRGRGQGVNGTAAAVVDASVATYMSAPNAEAASRLSLTDPAGAASAISSSILPPVTLSCTAVGEPHRACAAPNGTVTVVGYLADLNSPTAPNANNLVTDNAANTVVMAVKLLNPALAGRRDAVGTTGAGALDSNANSDIVDRQTMVFRMQEAY
ncbi:MAG: type II secretion system protein J [Alphaproteobacteria bacterium]